MRTKYKYNKYPDEKAMQKHFLSEENVLTDEIAKRRIIVNTKKNLKRFSLENSSKKEQNKDSKFNPNTNKIANSKVNININIENKNSNNEGINKIKNYNYRNRTNNNNNLILNNNKSDSSKKNILMKIFCEEKKSMNNNLKSPIEEKNNSIYRNYGSNRNYHLSSNIVKNSTRNEKKSYSIRNNSIRNYYKNISCAENKNIEKESIEKDNESANKYTKTKLFKKKYLEEYRNKIDKKEKEKDNEKKDEKELNDISNIIKPKEETIKKDYEEKNEKKKSKIKELKDIEININADNNIENNSKKEILVKRMKMKNYFKNRTKTQTNFNFLVHEAHENNRITVIFNKLYDSSPNITQNVDLKSKISNTNNSINNNLITENNNSLYINTNGNNNENHSKIKSMKSVYSILKTHSRNNITDGNHSSQNLIRDYKNLRDLSREKKSNNSNLINQRERNESVDTTNEDKTSVKTNLSNLQHLSNYNEINNSNDRFNYFFKKNYDFPKFKIICKNNNKLKNYFKKNNIEFNEKENEIKVENQIINNNTYNTTYNIFKINDKVSKQSPINIDIEPPQNKSEFQLNSPINNNVPNLYSQAYTTFSVNRKDDTKLYLDFEVVFVLEEKLKTIINKVNKYEICNDECYDWIRYYFYNEFYEKEINLFQTVNNKNNIVNIIKEEIICYFLSYEVSFSQNFNRISILLKAIFQLLHMNYLLFISFILNNNYIKIKSDEYDLVNQILNIINKELKINIYKENISEDRILQKMNDNFKQINNYYLMIIDNLYSYNDLNANINIYSFPNCLNLDINKITNIQKNNIIILFFYDAIKSMSNYNIQDLKKFYNLFLNKAKISFNSFFNTDNNNYKNIYSNNYNINNNKNQYYPRPLKVNQSKYLVQNRAFLPPINSPYTYTLVLDLDETLIHYKTEISQNYENPKKNMLILRPDLILFLKEMKKIYELVLFSYATYEYIEKILKIIESKEKFFDYILDRRHITYENGSYIKNLSLIGRDLKNVIIIDDKPQVFKMHKENGIFIKPFYGDCYNNKNILKNLINILKEIRKDVEITGDIRKSIQKKNHEIFTQITTGLIE